MEMQQLRYVVAVARTRNFTRAAEQCHVSQPSLSQQIQKLEEELGGRLFDRMKREAKLTPHGEAFLGRADRILEEVEAAKREAIDAHDLLCGTLTLGVLPTIAPYLLPRALAEFTKNFRAWRSWCRRTRPRVCSGWRTPMKSTSPWPACRFKTSVWR
jgi:LysR family hydrogen peroxide-inducible transcriptional activator